MDTALFAVTDPTKVEGIQLAPLLTLAYEQPIR